MLMLGIIKEWRSQSKLVERKGMDQEFGQLWQLSVEQKAHTVLIHSNYQASKHSYNKISNSQS